MIQIPLKTVAGLNAREAWAVRHRRVKREKEAVLWVLQGREKPALPCSVLLTRVSAGTLDDDNLVGALKAPRDAVAFWLGVDDKRRDVVRYRYAQRKGRRGEPLVEIEFGPMVAVDELEVA